MSPWWGEHIHRYEYALSLIERPSKILDIACGNGFGANLLCSDGKHETIGGDLSVEAIKYCNATFQSNRNISFRVMDGTALPFDSDTFDLITSFETIEHTTAYVQMLKEFKRTLKRGGILCLSTPNIRVNSPGGKVLNPYHTQEFTLLELQEILQSLFGKVLLMGQKYTRYDGVGFMLKIGSRVERLMYRRGIRKTPLRIQNAIMQKIIKKEIYPTSSDFGIVELEQEIQDCKTFIAVCRI